MKKYNFNTLMELYQVDNEYWETGNVDLLDKRLNLSKEIDEKFWDGIASVTSMVTREHKPLKLLVKVLKMLGYEEVLSF